MAANSKPQIYLYRWGNNPVRATLKGRRCRIVARGALNSCLIEFLDTGDRFITSRNALQRDKSGLPTADCRLQSSSSTNQQVKRDLKDETNANP